MKLILNETKYLKEPIMIISELVNEATFRIDKDKIELIAMDPANVSMVIFKLLSSAFLEYDVKEPLEISLNLDNLKQVLRRANPNDIITLELENNKLKIELKSDTKRTFNLSLLNLEEKQQRVPDLKFPLKIEISTMLFDQAIEDMGIISDSVTFYVDPEKFSIESLGNLTTAKVDLVKGDNILIDTSEKVKARYSVEYLKKIIKGSKIADKVTLQFNKEYPLKASYKVIDKMLLEFILAPRVAND
ncbi:MAG: proliferating cell nuclear antigen (pcna) [Nanoarchaeota archaeon]